MSELLPHEQRVVDEKSDLDAKCVKLETFILESAAYKPLSDGEKDLLSDQLRVMKLYSDILGERVGLFSPSQESDEIQISLGLSELKILNIALEDSVIADVHRDGVNSSPPLKTDLHCRLTEAYHTLLEKSDS